MIDDFFNHPFPVLSINERYLLREQKLKDTPIFFEYFSDPLVHRHILITIPQTLEDAKKEIIDCHQLFKLKQGIYWTLATQHNNEMIGSIGLHIREKHCAEIAYDLSRAYWNQGVMTQTLKHVLHFCFTTIQLTRIEAFTLKENTPSTKLLNKLGFIHEATMKHHRYYQGKYYDIERFVLTANNDE